MSLLILRVAGQRAGTIHHAVSLKIGLGHQINTIFITQVIPAWVIGIVAGTDRIDIHLFHDSDILNHTLQRNHISAVGVHLMTVGTLYKDRLTIDQQLAVTYLHLTESHLLRNDLNHLSVRFLKCYEQGVKIRGLCCPFVRISYLERELYGSVCNGL